MGEKIKHPENGDAFEKIIKGDKPVLADFYAEWCGPCQMMGPILDDLVKNYKSIDKVEVIKVDIDKLRDTALDLGIMSVPTFVVFNKGKAIETMVGMRSQAELESKLDAQLK
jgi:thioredoxin 1